ncbi:hypothetical protein [Mesorhizobium sp. A556]
MSKNHDGGPAFPRPKSFKEDGTSGVRVISCDEGMSLRDWIAGQILPSVLIATSAGQHQLELPSPATKADVQAAVARDAYELADAMLLAREVAP